MALECKTRKFVVTILHWKQGFLCDKKLFHYVHGELQTKAFKLYWWFNATLTAQVISWGSVTHMCFLAFSHQYYHNFSFQSHRLLFPHTSAEVRGGNTPERKVASTRDRTHNHQVVSPTRSPLSHPGRAKAFKRDQLARIVWEIKADSVS